VLNRACTLASRLGAERMVFFTVITPFDEAIASSGSVRLPSNEDEFAELLDEVDGFDGEAETAIVRSNTGFAACDFVGNSGAKLLIVPWKSNGDVRVLPAHMDWLLQVIPTNVWMMGA
jgi:sugar phosphate isomerase/epimerase